MMQQTGDYHFRQESSDSGLGMPPFGYSHPHTPENFLSSEFPTLNIAGIDLNIGGVSAMEMDTMEVTRSDYFARKFMKLVEF